MGMRFRKDAWEKKMTKSGVSWRSPVKIASDFLWEEIDNAAKKYAHGNLIDLGCGTKPYESLFKPYVNHYFGVDWEQTSELHYGTETTADLFADCTNTKLAEGSFDTLLSTQVMEHIYDTDAYLRECNRLLRKDGIAIFTVPFVWETHAEPYDFYRFTRYALEKLLVDHGFEIIKIEPIAGTYATLIQLKITSLYFRTSKNFSYKVFRKLRNGIFIPILNLMALSLDKRLWSDKLCLN